MKIAIKQHPKIELKPVKMNCDFKLHNKLDDTELTKRRRYDQGYTKK